MTAAAHPRARSALAVLGLGLVLGGCATAPQSAWRIVPVQTVAYGAGSAEGYYAIGRQIEHTRDWSRAADAYRQALQRDPGHVDARNALAVTLARLGLLKDAEAQLRQALAAAPQRADLHSNLGYLLLLARRPQEAQAALHTALALDPQDRVAQTNLVLAQGRAPASTPPSTALVQAGTSATTAAATTTPAAAVPAAAAPLGSSAGTALQVMDQPTLAPLVQASHGDLASASVSEVQRLVPTSGTTAAAMVASSTTLASGTLPAPAPFTLELSNGMGRPGAAQQLRRHLQGRGFEVQHTSNLPPYRQPYTVVLYQPGQEAAARRVARALPLSAPLELDAAQRTGVRVLIGQDWPAAVRVADAADTQRE